MTRQKFGEIGLRTTSEEVESILGKSPEYTSRKREKHWRYGNVEFYFELQTHTRKYACKMIFIERDKFPEDVRIRDWEMKIGYSLENCCDYLTSKSISFNKSFHVVHQISIENSHAKLTFNENDKLSSLTLRLL